MEKQTTHKGGLTAAQLIATLNLLPHPEGGHYRETYRCQQSCNKRSAATSIYFLLQTGEISRFHILTSDEIWFYHSGSAIEIFMLHPDGRLEIQKLGPDGEADTSFQLIIPAGTAFAAAPVPGDYGYSLVSCVVAPGFDFADFHLYGFEELTALFPAHRALIRRFT